MPAAAARGPLPEEQRSRSPPEPAKSERSPDRESRFGLPLSGDESDGGGAAGAPKAGRKTPEAGTAESLSSASPAPKGPDAAQQADSPLSSPVPSSPLSSAPSSPQAAAAQPAAAPAPLPERRLPEGSLAEHKQEPAPHLQSQPAAPPPQAAESPPQQADPPKHQPEPQRPDQMVEPPHQLPQPPQPDKAEPRQPQQPPQAPQSQPQQPQPPRSEPQPQQPPQPPRSEPQPPQPPQQPRSERQQPDPPQPPQPPQPDRAAPSSAEPTLPSQSSPPPRRPRDPPPPWEREPSAPAATATEEPGLTEDVVTQPQTEGSRERVQPPQAEGSAQRTPPLESLFGCGGSTDADTTALRLRPSPPRPTQSPPRESRTGASGFGAAGSDRRRVVQVVGVSRSPERLPEGPEVGGALRRSGLPERVCRSIVRGCVEAALRIAPPRRRCVVAEESGVGELAVDDSGSDGPEPLAAVMLRVSLSPRSRRSRIHDDEAVPEDSVRGQLAESLTEAADDAAAFAGLAARHGMRDWQSAREQFLALSQDASEALALSAAGQATPLQPGPLRWDAVKLLAEKVERLGCELGLRDAMRTEKLQRELAVAQKARAEAERSSELLGMDCAVLRRRVDEAEQAVPVCADESKEQLLRRAAQLSAERRQRVDELREARRAAAAAEAEAAQLRRRVQDLTEARRQVPEAPPQAPPPQPRQPLSDDEPRSWVGEVSVDALAAKHRVDDPRAALAEGRLRQLAEAVDAAEARGKAAEDAAEEAAELNAALRSQLAVAVADARRYSAAAESFASRLQSAEAAAEAARLTANAAGAKAKRDRERLQAALAEAHSASSRWCAQAERKAAECAAAKRAAAQAERSHEAALRRESDVGDDTAFELHSATLEAERVMAASCEQELRRATAECTELRSALGAAEEAARAAEVKGSRDREELLLEKAELEEQLARLSEHMLAAESAAMPSRAMTAAAAVQCRPLTDTVATQTVGSHDWEGLLQETRALLAKEELRSLRLEERLRERASAAEADRQLYAARITEIKEECDAAVARDRDEVWALKRQVRGAEQQRDAALRQASSAQLLAEQAGARLREAQPQSPPPKPSAGTVLDAATQTHAAASLRVAAQPQILSPPDAPPPDPPSPARPVLSPVPGSDAGAAASETITVSARSTASPPRALPSPPRSDREPAVSPPPPEVSDMVDDGASPTGPSCCSSVDSLERALGLMAVAVPDHPPPHTSPPAAGPAPAAAAPQEPPQEQAEPLPPIVPQLRAGMIRRYGGVRTAVADWRSKTTAAGGARNSVSMSQLVAGIRVVGCGGLRASQDLATAETLSQLVLGRGGGQMDDAVDARVLLAVIEEAAQQRRRPAPAAGPRAAAAGPRAATASASAPAAAPRPDLRPQFALPSSAAITPRRRPLPSPQPDGPPRQAQRADGRRVPRFRRAGGYSKTSSAELTAAERAALLDVLTKVRSGGGGEPITEAEVFAECESLDGPTLRDYHCWLRETFLTSKPS
eukprot:TRINITY_DN463_c0_g2_i3.p1 TRINITY_DN463_c0_g2~~TRINITY_DN463_c0_g2_i3.p1  ORF type:complete len:1658 (+),score=501.40 TRINITY_DN463_c0_g2_i3:464-4975(+)